MSRLLSSDYTMTRINSLFFFPFAFPILFGFGHCSPRLPRFTHASRIFSGIPLPSSCSHCHCLFSPQTVPESYFNTFYRISCILVSNLYNRQSFNHSSTVLPFCLLPEIPVFTTYTITLFSLIEIVIREIE